MKRTLKPVFPPAGIESEYRKQLQKAVRKMEKSCVYWLRARYRANEDKILDSATSDLLQAFRRLLRQWERNFRELADTLPRWFVSKIRGYVTRNLAEQTRPLRDAGLGFNLKFSYMSQKERQTFAAIVAENVSLIKSIARESLTQVEGIVLRSIEDGHDLETLTKRLHQQFGVSERRAAMIARDQTNKATNNLSRQRLLSYGVTKGVWMHTSAGKTYRDTHIEEAASGGMNGQEYDIREGCFDPNPNVSRNIQPGELVNCRCVCRPLIPTLSEEETEQGIEEILQEVGEPLNETPKAETQEEKQEFGFVQANTIQEADAYMMDKYGIQANYKGVDLVAANEWNAGLTDAFDNFPELKLNFGFVGEAHNRYAIIKDRVAAYVESWLNNFYGNTKPANYQDVVKRQITKSMGRFRIDLRAYAISYKSNSAISQGLDGVCLNKSQAKNAAKMIEALKNDVKDGFHPIGCDTIKSVLDHELGHQLDNLLILSDSRDFLDYYNTLSPKDIREGLSAYANKSKREFLAEAWAEYRNNPKPRPIAKKVGEMLAKTYKAKYKGAKP